MPLHLSCYVTLHELRSVKLRNSASEGFARDPTQHGHAIPRYRSNEIHTNMHASKQLSQPSKRYYNNYNQNNGKNPETKLHGTQ